MPTPKQVIALLKELAAVKAQLEKHLLEGESVKTDIKWLKSWMKYSMGLQSGILLALVAGVFVLLAR